MKLVSSTLFLLSVVALTTGCSDNPTGPPAEEALTFNLDTGTTELQTLTEVAFTLTIMDRHGDTVTNYEELQLERRLEGTTSWRAIPMTLDGSVFRGQYTFSTSGEYELRVMGTEAHADHNHDGATFSTTQTEMVELHRFSEHFHVHRIHHEVGDYQVEFESFPGHIHEGETATFMFWVEDAHSEHSHGEPTPITGLDAEIRCSESNGTTHTMTATESSPGVYESDHLVEMAGATSVALLFMDAASNQMEFSFQFEVAHGH